MRREALRNGVHLAVLFGLVLAQPLFDILGRNATFFAVRDSASSEIVLFAVALTVAPPAVLVLAELAAATLSRALARALHLVFVGGLVAVLALYGLTTADALSGGLALAAAGVAGAGGAIAYRQVRAARAFLTVLAPAPIVFAALFLFSSPVSKLVFASTPEVQAGTVRARTPVVLIALDEASTVSLMDGRERIDAGRYPNFAALARDSTWYRNATTSFWLTEGAVPSILTGRVPTPGQLPVFSDHPRNLFTLLGGAYRMRTVETLTNLCPRTICRDTPTVQTRAVRDTTGSLASDVGIVYLHLLLPEPFVDRVPPISDTWGNFGGREESEEPVSPRRSGPIPACGRSVCEFTDLISADRRPTLYFLHSLLPHVPYVYLPSGRRYAVDARVLRGLENGRWREPWAALQSYQRYLLQLGYTDRALGLILRKLRTTGVYDRALVVVVADHGVTFRVGEPRRLATSGNLDDIAFVPLFVKLPHQRQGRIDDSFARTIDVLPTIARVAGVSIPWHVDGRSLVGRRLAADGTVSVVAQKGSRIASSLTALRARRSRALAEQVAVFGTGTFSAVYRIGPRRELLGRSVAELPVRASGAAGVELDERTLLDAVDPDSGLLPSYIEGRITGELGAGQDLAVAVNGTIAAVTRTFDQHGETRFSAFVPPETLRRGRNAVEVFAILGEGEEVVLDELRGGDLSLTLRGEMIEAEDGRTIRVRPGALQGTVRVSTSESGFVFTGSARLAGLSGRADTLLVFAGDRAVYRGRAANLRPHRILGQRALGKHGFTFELPRALLPAPGDASRVRVFAVQRGVASELAYAPGYPWRVAGG